MSRQAIRESRFQPHAVVDGHVRLGEAVPRRGRLVVPLGFGVVLLVVVAGIVAAHHGSCPATASEKRQVSDLITQGKHDQAAGMAELHLAAPRVCDANKIELATLRYRALMAGVYEKKEEDGERAALRWQEAERSATPYRVAVDAPEDVASRAYQRGLWQLARTAFQKAWTLRPNPRAVSSLYYPTLYNWADELLRSQDRDKELQGLSVLRTACEISQVYMLVQREACHRLGEKLGTDQSGWPPRLPDDPVLAANRR